MKVVVIGGGPVGLYTAIALEKNGYLVDVYEKGSWPIDKACGQGIMPSGVDLLKDIGLSFKEGENYFPFKGISYFDSDQMIRADLPRCGYGVERNTLSKMLFDLANKKRNINLFANSPVVDSFISENKFVLSINGELKKYEFAFACDGINSSLRMKYHNQKSKKKNLRMGAREHFWMKPWSHNVEVYWKDGIEAYVTPVSDKKIEIAFLWYDSFDFKGANLREKLWEKFPELAEKVDIKSSARDFRGSMPFVAHSSKIKVKNIFFVGDAFCFIDGITGEGISLGIKSSKIITSRFIKWSCRDNLEVKFLYFHYTIMVNIALFLARWKRLRTFVFNFLQRNPSIFRFILKINDL